MSTTNGPKSLTFAKKVANFLIVAAAAVTIPSALVGLFIGLQQIGWW